ncbi:MAG: UPF0182 family protein, partial [Terriglobales bacterium]
FLGARDSGAYTDPVFGHDLAFYFFRLPFYEMAFHWIATLAVVGLVLAAVTLAMGSSSERWQEMRARLEAQMEGRAYVTPARPMADTTRRGLLALLRGGAVVLLLIFAVAQFFARYGLLYSSHRFLTGADFVDVRIGLPLLWVQIVGALILAVLIAVARRRGGGFSRPGWGARTSALSRELRESLERWTPTNSPRWLAPVAVAAFLVLAIAPGLIQGIVRGAYVSPNELTLERPYIANHIHATRMAFNLEQTSHEEAFNPSPTDSVNLTKFEDTASNLRLWDAGPFQDDVTQLQALRPYYAFANVDVDRYRIQGQTRQVLIAARGLDTSLLPATAQSWVTLSLQYTHGYGAVAAMVNSATPEGQPELVLKNAPPVSQYPALAISRPGLYFGEDTT